MSILYFATWECFYALTSFGNEIYFVFCFFSCYASLPKISMIENLETLLSVWNDEQLIGNNALKMLFKAVRGIIGRFEGNLNYQLDGFLSAVRFLLCRIFIIVYCNLSVKASNCFLRKKNYYF